MYPKLSSIRSASPGKTIRYPGAQSIFFAASRTFSRAVPRGRFSRFAERTTSRERSRRLISEGVVERCAVTSDESGTRAGPFLPPGTATRRSPICWTSWRISSGSRTRTLTASPSSSSKVVTAWPPTRDPTIRAIAGVASPASAARSRSTIRRYSGRSSSSVTSRSTIPGIR